MIQCYYDSLGNFVHCGYIGFAPDWLILTLGILFGIGVGILIMFFCKYKINFEERKV